MVAYRLHFERANLEAIEVARSGRIGEPRFFTSSFTMQRRARQHPRAARQGGGTLYDIGIYCINAARYLFRDEPSEVVALTADAGDRASATWRRRSARCCAFPDERLARFTCSFGADRRRRDYRLVGTKGELRLDPAYEYAELPRAPPDDGRQDEERDASPKRDQFAPELLYFSRLHPAEPRPGARRREGLADVRMIRALYQLRANRPAGRACCC